MSTEAPAPDRRATLRRAWQAALAIAALSVAVRLVWAAWATVTPLSDFAGYGNLAWHWLTSGEFGYGDRRAYRTPGLPAYLAATYAVCGRDPRAVGLVNAAVGGVTSGLVVLLAARRVSVHGAVLAGVLHAVSPTAVAYVPVLATENLAAPLVVASLLALAVAQDRRGPRGVGWAAAAGVLFGALLLTRPATLFMLPAFLILAALDFAQRQRTLRLLVAAAAGLVVAVAPWSLRNAVLGLSPLTLSTQGGRALWWDIFRYVYPEQIDRRPELGEGLAEDEQDQVLRDGALRWIRTHPGLYLAMTRVRLLRIFGTSADPIAASYLVPTAENDRAVTMTWDASRGGPPVPPGIKKRFGALHAQGLQYLGRYQMFLAPLALAALLLALTRWRAHAIFLMPLFCYWGGHALTVFVERYRQVSDPLVFILVGALLGDILFGEHDLGPRLARGAKLIVTAFILHAVLFVHATGLADPWYRFPPVFAEEPDTTGLRFTPVRFADPLDSYRSDRWVQRMQEVRLSRADGGLRCDLVGSPDVARSQYGGIRFAVQDFGGLRLRLAVERPENIQQLYVDGHDPDGERIARWVWSLTPGMQPPAGICTHTLLPGRYAGYFVPERTQVGKEALRITSVHIFAKIHEGLTAAFILHAVEIAAGALPAPDVTGCTPAPLPLDRPAGDYRTEWLKRLDDHRLEQRDGALHFSAAASAEGPAGHYGGVRLAAPGSAGLRLTLSFERPENIERVYVDGQAARRQRVARWSWRPRSGAALPATPATFAFVPGADCGWFDCEPGPAAGPVEAFDVFVKLRRGTSAGFTIERAEALYRGPPPAEAAGPASAPAAASAASAPG